MGRRVVSRGLSTWGLALNLSNLLWQAGLIDRMQYAQVAALVEDVRDRLIAPEVGVRLITRVWDVRPGGAQDSSPGPFVR